MINQRSLSVSLLVVLFAVSFYLTYQYLQPFQKIKIRDRELRVNPHVKIDPAKRYRITLWDYDWSLPTGNYREYLQRQIRDFRRIYPNITVQLRLLDLLTGPGELAEALKKGHPPDLYCAALTIPEFDYKYQAPVGPYFKPEMWEKSYLSAVGRLTEIDGVKCSFPYWVRPRLWVGNRQLLERAGVSIAQIQTQGWSWEEVLGLRVKSAEEVLLAGKVVPEAVLHAIGTPRGLTNLQGAEWGLLQKIRDSKVFPVEGDQRMLEYFLNGRAAVLAGVTPLIWRYLEKRLVSSGASWEMVCLPEPIWRTKRSRRTVELGVINVYRQPRLGSDIQVAAAMKLGEYLSLCRGDAQPWHEMMVIPAASIAAAHWFQEAAPPDKPGSGLRVLEQEMAGANLRLQAGAQTRLGKVASVVRKFLSGALSQSAAIERLQDESSDQ